MTKRLVLSYLAITLIVLILLETPLAIFYSQREEERFIADVERDAVVLASFYEDVLHHGFELDPVPASNYQARTTARVVLVARDGISVFDTSTDTRRNFSTRPEIQTALTGIRSSGIRHSETLEADLLYVAVPVASGGTVHGALRLTIDPVEVTNRIQRFWLGLIAIGCVVIGAVAGVGWTIARSVTKPLRQLQAAAGRFSEGDLRTLAIDDEAPREITDLVETMNLMATRLDDLITKQRSFVGDASHQLRTPLTALRLRLENLEASLDDELAITETSAAIDEIERLTTLVNDLLGLARAQQQPPQESVDANAIVADRVDTWSALAEENNIVISLLPNHQRVCVYATPGMLEQLLDNTIDNAMRVSSPGSTIEVGIVPGPDTTTVFVCDHGPGLSRSDKVRALERFWRGDASSHGSGLGLTIAQTLTEANGGELHLVDTLNGGLTVKFELNTAPPSKVQTTATGKR